MLMTHDYSEMDAWTEEEVAAFKDAPERVVFTESFREPSPSAKLVAEGDSWFDFLPGTDLIDCLRNHHGYSIRNFGKAGDTLENMIYGSKFNSSFKRTPPTIKRVLSFIEAQQPHAFLFSGGGNDIAGDEFASYLNHRDSGLPLLRMDYINEMIHTIFHTYLRNLIAKVAAVSPETRIVMHGYGHTRPTGKGVSWLFFDFAGPWLKPALASKGVTDEAESNNAVKVLIDSYNEMLTTLDAEYETFCHVDLRPILNEETDWRDELHLRNSAFARAADQLHAAIQA